jgi:hypothetical protein
MSDVRTVSYYTVYMAVFASSVNWASLNTKEGFNKGRLYTTNEFLIYEILFT